jgi:hypothetical protein
MINYTILVPEMRLINRKKMNSPHKTKIMVNQMKIMRLW